MPEMLIFSYLLMPLRESQYSETDGVQPRGLLTRESQYLLFIAASSCHFAICTGGGMA